jgi:hypothetical protein
MNNYTASVSISIGAAYDSKDCGVAELAFLAAKDAGCDHASCVFLLGEVQVEQGVR